MRRLYFLFSFCSLLFAGSLFGQATLPDFTLKNTNGKVSIFWLNDYKKPVKGISVQRSYDSTRNFFSIASILNPQNSVNGFTDSTPPYNKMYYRLFIGFDTGVYLLTPSKRPEVNTVIDYTRLIQEINALYEKNILLQEEKMRLQKQLAEALAAKNKNKAPAKTAKTAKTNKTAKKPDPTEVSEDIISQVITYPSKRIFTDKDNNVVAKIFNVKANRYVIRFLTEDYKLLFEIKNPPEDYFILEKVNFTRAGWYQFEIYKNEYLLEENKFYISSEEKKTK
ncbi:MAG: hypothetical protein IPL54_04860 [Chitinophagaceae bacterium]|nr:hypothetical protein [Chitinophagaceae bacterium]